MSRPNVNFPFRFPRDFLFGVSTSSYQIEGAVHEGGRGKSIWDTFCDVPGKILDGSTGEIACDHYHRWAGDLDLIKETGASAYRFSIAWPRILPEGTGAVAQAGLDFYDCLIDGMLQRGIHPYATLYHWDLPQALQEKGGWMNRSIIEAFVHYVDTVTRRLGDRVKAYITLNEPWCSSMLSHYIGMHAPGLQDRKKALQAAHHLLLAHGSALSVLRANAPAANVGIALNVCPGYPANPESFEDIAAAERWNGFYNNWFSDPLFKGRYPEVMWNYYGADVPQVRAGDFDTISRPLDFLGINYYTREVIQNAPESPLLGLTVLRNAQERTHMDWEVFPQGFTDILLQLHRQYNLPPVYITENGAAYPDILSRNEIKDVERIRYIERHLQALNEAMLQGVDVKGYFLWSLMDNFEWAEGYTKRFGIYYVDYPTQRRIPKQSAAWYAELIARCKNGELA
ncbi:MAG TPA: GH1 family beta-glucosidase [Gammaproteobacteria bacterium]|nr:GH1 family beta-glucosidase [Gammaproteobacteria bacterium]